MTSDAGRRLKSVVLMDRHRARKHQQMEGNMAEKAVDILDGMTSVKSTVKVKKVGPKNGPDKAIDKLNEWADIFDNGKKEDIKRIAKFCKVMDGSLYWTLMVGTTRVSTVDGKKETWNIISKEVIDKLDGATKNAKAANALRLLSAKVKAGSWKSELEAGYKKFLDTLEKAQEARASE